MADNDELLRILIQLSGRQAFPPERLRIIVGSGKNLTAYNLCDGSRTQTLLLDALEDGQHHPRPVLAGHLLGPLLGVRLTHAGTGPSGTGPCSAASNSDSSASKSSSSLRATASVTY